MNWNWLIHGVAIFSLLLAIISVWYAFSLEAQNRQLQEQVRNLSIQNANLQEMSISTNRTCSEGRDFLLSCLSLSNGSCPLNEKDKLRFYDKSVQLGYYSYYNGKYPDAITNFRDALTIFKDRADQEIFQLYIGNSYCHLGNYSESMMIYENVINSTNNFQVGMTGKMLLMGCLATAGRTDNNSMYFKRILSLYEEIRPYYENYGTREELSLIYESAAFAYHRLGDHNLSAAFYKKQMLLNPNNADIWANYALELCYAGEEELSKNASRTALSLDPNNNMAKYVLEACLGGELIFQVNDLSATTIFVIPQTVESIINSRRVYDSEGKDIVFDNITLIRNYKNETIEFNATDQDGVVRTFQAIQKYNYTELSVING